jgi:hypothetical protein
MCSDVDTEEDPVVPITPLPGARFELRGAPPPAPASKEKVGDAYADDGFVDARGEMDIKHDCVYPVPPPAAVTKRDRRRAKERVRRRTMVGGRRAEA